MRQNPDGMNPSPWSYSYDPYFRMEDPECQRNLVDEQFEKAAELRGLLVDWLQDAPETNLARRAGVSDPGVLAELAALGYATDEQSEAQGEVLFRSDPKGNEWDKRFDG